MSGKKVALMTCILLCLLAFAPVARSVFASTTYIVGVKLGDWACYGDISYDLATNSSENEEQLAGFGDYTWMKAEILDVSDSNVTSRLTAVATNGSETNTTSWWDIATFQGNSNTTTFIIPSGLKAGDPIPGSQYVINSTILGHYAGADRKANCLIITNSSTQYDDSYDLTTDYEINVTACWDQEVGFLSEFQIVLTSTSSNSSINYYTNLSFHTKMTATNMWSAVFTINDGYPYNYNITVSSNSSISDVSLNETLKQIGFNASGPTGWVCYSDITIPKALLKGDPWTVYINGTDWTDQCSFSENFTHAFIYIPYTCSTNSVRINGTWVVPEFSPYFTLLALVIVALAGIMVHKKSFN